MADRWKHWLAPLDDGTPGDDVFDRARAGSSRPEAPFKLPSGRSRVITVVAAFLVFALAIAVFAIPALRLKDDGTTSIQGVGAGIQPLWPWRTLDEVKAFAADPQPVNGMDPSVTFAPDQFASAFGTQVLGWGNEVWANEVGGAAYTDCVTWGGDMSSTPSAPYLGAPCSLAPPTVSASAFRTYHLNICPQDVLCDRAYQGLGDASVVVYQPLGADGPWAVIEAKSQYLDLSAGAGDVVHDGSPLSVVASIPDGYHGALVTHIGTGESSCDPTEATSGFDRAVFPNYGGIALSASTAKITVRYSPTGPGDTCPSTSAGYVLAAIAVEPLLGVEETVMFDPLANSGHPRLFAFAAVPIVAMSGDTGATEAPPTVDVAPPTEVPSSSSPTPVGWTTYTDNLGWTIDVPQGWSTQPIDSSNDTSSYEGAAFGSGPILQLLGDSTKGPMTLTVSDGEVMVQIAHIEGNAFEFPTNDATFPLSFDDMTSTESGSAMSFRGDGIWFVLSIRSSAPTDEQQQILRQMVESIRFAPWSTDEQRGSYVATPWSSSDVGIGNPKVVWFGGRYWVLGEADQAPSGAYEVDGPVPLCPDSSTGDVRIGGDHMATSLTCPDGTTAGWFGGGDPLSSNPQPYAQSLPQTPLIAAWDGTLLASVDSLALVSGVGGTA